MMEKILVPTDFSETARGAYPVAAELAREYGGTIHLVHVVAPISPFYYEEIAVDFPQEKFFENIGRRLGDEMVESAFDGVPVKKHLVAEQPPHRGLIDFAEKESMNLIVLSTHGRTGVGHALLGSFTERVVRLSSIPVLTVRSRSGSARWAPRHALVPIDFSENSEAVLPFVRFLAKYYGTRFTFVNVIEPAGLVHGHALPPAYLKAAEEAEEGARLQATLHFGKMESEALEGVEADFVAADGPISTEIARVAKATGADLVLMSTHGRTGLSHLFLGSVADQVVRSAPCSVLTVKPGKIVSFSDEPETAERYLG